MLLAHRVTALQIPFGRTDLLKKGSLAGWLTTMVGTSQTPFAFIFSSVGRSRKLPMLDAVDAQVDGR